jgi:hypothetical protein
MKATLVLPDEIFRAAKARAELEQTVNAPGFRQVDAAMW